MEKQRLWIRWLGGSLLTISLLFFSNGNVSAAKILTKYGSLPLYREDLMPLTVERPSFYDDPPLWTIRLRNQPQGLLAPETGFYRPIYGIMRRRTPVFRTVRPLLPPQSAHLPTAVGPRKSSHFWCASPVPTAARPSVRLPLFLQDRGLSKFLSLNLESQSRMGIGGSFRRKCPAYAIIKDNLSQFGTSHWAWGP